MGIEIVAGINLRNLNPRVWDPDSIYHLPDLKAIMVSYADFSRDSKLKDRAFKEGLHKSLGVPNKVQIYLDNGAFYFLKQGKGEVPRQSYEAFIQAARPDWYVIPQDYIPSPQMSDEEQLDCLRNTMQVNLQYQHDGYVPVIHICRQMDEYLSLFLADPNLVAKPIVGLGGIVPNLLRATKAMHYQDVLDAIRRVRERLAEQRIHVFGIGGTATLHIAALMEVNSVDSSGWRNRAARGIVQLPGRGDRTVANLGNWRGRKPDNQEWEILTNCTCPACQEFGLDGLKADKLAGFCNRATHNLWTLLKEERQIDQHISDGTYSEWCLEHIENSTYKPLVEYLLENRHT